MSPLRRLVNPPGHDPKNHIYLPLLLLATLSFITAMMDRRERRKAARS